MDTAASRASVETVRLLKQLQEFEITLREARIVHGEVASLEAIEGSIANLRKLLNIDVLARYDRLSTIGPAVVDVHNGMCMKCNMQIPRGDLNRVLTGKGEPTCPNCGVYIFVTS